MELTSKQRAQLRAMASNIEPIFQIGKQNLTDAQVDGIGDALEKRELVKITVLRSAEDSAKEILQTLCARLDATPVCTIGSKVILYRKSKSDKVKHIEF